MIERRPPIAREELRVYTSERVGDGREHPIERAYCELVRSVRAGRDA
jgi:hypothetical protein